MFRFLKLFLPGAATVNSFPAWARWCVVLVMAVAGGMLARNVIINDNALDLLPGDAVRGDLQILKRLGLVDRIFLTLSVEPNSHLSDSEAEAILKESADLVGRFLAQSHLLSEVIYKLPHGYEFGLFATVQPYLPVLLDEHDYIELDLATTPVRIDQSLCDNFILLNSPAGIAIKKQVQQDPLGIIRLVLKKLKHLRSEFSMDIVDGFFLSRDCRSCLIMAESTLSLTDSKNAKTVQAVVDSALSSGLNPAIQGRVIGSLPHTLANARSIQHDLRTLLPIATILLLLLLGSALRDGRALLVFGIPFLTAPSAVCATACIFGEISRLALGFGIVLLGISVDFAVHLYLALTRESGGHKSVLQRIRRPIILAVLTTTSVFIVLLFSQVPSHKQMATLALISTLLAVSVSWLVIPSIATAGKRVPDKAACFVMPGRYSSARMRFIILAVWVGLLAAGLLAWQLLHYNGDLRVLDAPDQQVIADEQHFRDTWGQQGEQTFVVASGTSLNEALNKNSQIYETIIENNVNVFQSLSPLIPGPVSQQRNMQLWKRFWHEKRPLFDKQFEEIAVKHGYAVNGFAPFFQWLDREPAFLLPLELLSGSLQPLLATMIRTPEQQQAKMQDAPDKFLIITTVAADKELLSVLLALEQADSGITVLDSRKWRNQVEKLLRKDIVFLSFAASVIIVFLTVVIFKQIKAIVGVLAPVASALASMSLFSFLSSGELNMMHLLMGIMVIGLSVDYGIFVVCSCTGHIINVSSFAVSVCAASSLLGFGVLAFADHPALHSLGVTVLAGIGAAWPTAIWVSPAILNMTGREVV